MTAGQPAYPPGEGFGAGAGSGYGSGHGHDPAAQWHAGQAPASQPPVDAGGQQQWQDDHGQWHAPWPEPTPQWPPSPPAPQVGHAPVAPAAPALDGRDAMFVPASELQPVEPPRYLAPARVPRDPRRATLAAVLTFVSLLMGLWAILAFTSSLAATLTSVAAGNEQLKTQLAVSNAGLARIEGSTAGLAEISEDTETLGTMLGSIDEDMTRMLAAVDRIGVAMDSTDSSLGTLNQELGAVNDINSGMATTLASIDAGLKDQVSGVRTMRRDVQRTGRVLGSLPPRLDATNGRLGHINTAVDVMGCNGITNDLDVTVYAGPIRTGSARVTATVVPSGAWGTRADGVTPC